MTSALSREAARRLRPAGAFHLPPPSQSIGSVVELVVDDSELQPEIILTDERRSLSWRVAMSLKAQKWHAEVMMPMDATLVRYYFEFPDGSKLLELRQFEGHNHPEFGTWRSLPYQIAVYNPAGMPPEWTRGMVIYQIFPDRFANGDTSTDREAIGVYGHPPLFKAWGDIPEHPPLGRDFYGGDLRGVIEKLDYLKDLGVECIYFTPLFASPSNHRYDALDYMQIDPMLGTEAEFAELLEAAHARSIHIVLDAVYNHCSVDSRYFGAGKRYQDVSAIETKESPYYRWFDFIEWPKSWVGWEGFSHMPEFVESPEVEEYFTGAHGPTYKWTVMGVDGWRTDVTSRNSDEFWRRWRRRLDRINPSNYTVAEEWQNASHYLLGDMFSATMNYRFAWAVYGFFIYDKLTASEMDDRLLMWLRDTPGPAICAQMNLIDSHDTMRAYTACMKDRSRFKQTVAFQFSYPGAPMIYYGDETALEGDYTENGRRTMPWDNLDADMINFYKHIIACRRESEALRHGEVATVVLDDAARLYAFGRRAGTDTAYCVFNGGDKKATIDIPLADGNSGMWRDLLSESAAAAEHGTLSVPLPSRGYGWYVPA
jgi:cyclomaltodextrinase / maltogenic alpha-amylase / neopullulanase